VAQVLLVLAVGAVSLRSRARKTGRVGGQTTIEGALEAVGLMIMIGSIAVVVRARLVLGKGLVVFPKPPDDAVLCQRDIYGMVRHPVYSAVIAGTAGWALFWRSPPGLLGSIPVAVFFRLKSQHEERYLLARFPEYGEYRRRVPALMPRLPWWR
jgi:protein-S-isoprenylcysteine O-methyltransferase Ste14